MTEGQCGHSIARGSMDSRNGVLVGCDTGKKITCFVVRILLLCLRRRIMMLVHSEKDTYVHEFWVLMTDICDRVRGNRAFVEKIIFIVSYGL